MKFGYCGHEKEVTELLRSGRWPGIASTALRAHAASCDACRSLIAVTEAMGNDRAQAFAQAQLPPPGLLWWRAQLRRRNQVMRQVRRPLMAAQVFALLLGLAAAVVCIVLGAGTAGRLVEGLPDALHLKAMLPVAWQDSPAAAWLLLLLFAAVPLVGGILIYKASEER